MSQKTFFGRILAWIANIFHHAETELISVILPFISHFLDAVKSVVESPLTSLIVDFIPGTLPKEIFDKIKTILPKVALEFGLVIQLEHVTTPDELNTVLQKIFATVKWPTEVDKQKFLSSFGARILQEIQDNKMTFATAIIDIEYFFKNYHDAIPALPASANNNGQQAATVATNEQPPVVANNMEQPATDATANNNLNHPFGNA